MPIHLRHYYCLILGLTYISIFTQVNIRNSIRKFTQWRLAVLTNPTKFGVKRFQGTYFIFSINSVLQQRK